jgi:predicted transposase/invertase (TIGR01784 family)
MTIIEQLAEERKGEWMAMAMQQGVEKGKREGKLEGRMESVEKVALNMLSKRLDEKLISETTGLSLEEIRKLEKKYSKV